MNENLQSLIFYVGLPTLAAIVLIGVGLFGRFGLGWRILIFVAAAAMSIPGLFALYLLMAFSSLGHL